MTETQIAKPNGWPGSGSRKENNHGIALFAFTILFPFLSVAHATTIPNVKIVSCYDADTCRVNLPRSAFNDDWAYELFGHNIPIRVEGIDTPEIRGQCQKEKDLAYGGQRLGARSTQGCSVHYPYH